MTDTIAYIQAEAEANWLRTHQHEIWAKTHKYLYLSGYLTYRLTGRFVDSIGCQVGFMPFDYKKLHWAGKWDWKWQVVPMPREILRSEGFPTTVRNLVADGVRRAILPDGPADLAMAAGSSDTRLYIVPSRSLVIVRFGWQDRPSWSDAAFLRPILSPGAGGPR